MVWGLVENSVLVAVVLGNGLVAVGSAVVGTFAVLRREALLADVLAHAVLPGVILAYMFTGRKELPVLALGALIMAVVAMGVISVLRGEPSVREDARLGIVLVSSFGIGITLLTVLQQWHDPNTMALWRFLFGQAAAVTWADALLVAAVVVPVVGFVAAAFKELLLLAFDAEFARTLPLRLRWVEVGYRLAVVAVIVVGIQSVGALLMGAFFVLPPMAARLWTRRVHTLLVVSALLAVLAVLAGIGASLVVPRGATGPVMVVVAAVIVVLSHVLAPRRGLLAAAWRWLLRALRRWDEHAHKAMYRLAESRGMPCREGWRLAGWRRLSTSAVVSVGMLLWLWVRGSLRWCAPWGWAVTKGGAERAQRIVRRHRLWEAYLEHVLGVPSEHVHSEAEWVEHVLTPELERRLEELLDYPAYDPHGRSIPRQRSEE